MGFSILTAFSVASVLSPEDEGMSAIPEQFVRKTARVSEAVTRPFPNSRKVYVEGGRPDIRVPMREISQSETPSSFGAEANPPVPVYDTSGPYTDPGVTIDLL